MPVPQAMPVPDTEPLDGVGETVSVARSSCTTTCEPFTSSGCVPCIAEPFTFTVSPPSASVSATGVSVNVPEALPAPPGIDIVKFPTDAKSRPSLAVPPFTFTVTDFDEASCAAPVSDAVTVTVRAPPSSATRDGLASRTTFGSQVTVTRRSAAVRRSELPEPRMCVARNRYVRTAGEAERSVCGASFFATSLKTSPSAVLASVGDTLYHRPSRALAPCRDSDLTCTFAEAVSFAASSPPSSPITRTDFFAASLTSGAVSPQAPSAQSPPPTRFLARTRTS